VKPRDVTSVTRWNSSGLISWNGAKTEFGPAPSAADRKLNELGVYLSGPL